MFENYDIPNAILQPASPGIPWVDVLARWKFIAADLLDIGIDVGPGQLGVLRSRSWPWLRDAINGLMLRDTTRIGKWRNAYIAAQIDQAMQDDDDEPEEDGGE